MNPGKPKYLYTVYAIYSDAPERMKQRKPFCVFWQTVDTNARKANAMAREYAKTGEFCSVTVKNTKNKRETKIL